MIGSRLLFSRPSIQILTVPSRGWVGALLSDSGSTCSPECPSDEREQQGQDARDRENGSQPLLRDVLCSLAGRSGQCDAPKLVHETCTHRCSYECQYNRYH